MCTTVSGLGNMQECCFFVLPALSRRRREHRQGAGQEVVAGGGEGRAGEETEPQGPRRHQGEHRGAAVLQGNGFQVTTGVIGLFLSLCPLYYLL